MKIINTIMIVYLTFSFNKTIANPQFRAELSGLVFKDTTGVSANVNLTYHKTDYSKLYVSSLDSYITNNEDRQIKIPIENLYLICDNRQFQISNKTKQLFYLDTYPDFSEISQKNITLKLENTGELPKGLYSVVLKFFKQSETIEDECDFLLTFNIEDDYRITLLDNETVIALSEEDVFSKNSTIKNKNDINLNLFANANWKLYLDTLNFTQDECEYYFRIKSISGNITNYEQDIVQIRPNQRYFLASGIPTLKGIEANNQVPSGLVIEYSLRNPDQKDFIKEGVRLYPIRYTMERN